MLLFYMAFMHNIREKSIELASQDDLSALHGSFRPVFQANSALHVRLSRLRS